MRAFSTSAPAAAAAAAGRSLKIMFLGAPGAGKGTYASRIAPMLQIPTISTGDLVRHEIKTGTQLGEQIKVQYLPECVLRVCDCLLTMIDWCVLRVVVFDVL